MATRIKPPCALRGRTGSCGPVWPCVAPEDAVFDVKNRHVDAQDFVSDPLPGLARPCLGTVSPAHAGRAMRSLRGVGGRESGPSSRPVGSRRSLSQRARGPVPATPSYRRYRAPPGTPIRSNRSCRARPAWPATPMPKLISSKTGRRESALGAPPLMDAPLRSALSALEHPAHDIWVIPLHHDLDGVAANRPR